MWIVLLLATAPSSTDASNLLPFGFSLDGRHVGSCAAGDTCACTAPKKNCTALAALNYEETTTTSDLGGGKTLVTVVYDPPHTSHVQIARETTLYRSVARGKTTVTAETSIVFRNDGSVRCHAAHPIPHEVAFGVCACGWHRFVGHVEVHQWFDLLSCNFRKTAPYYIATSPMAVVTFTCSRRCLSHYHICTPYEQTRSPKICGVNVVEAVVTPGGAPTLHTFNGSFASRTDYASSATVLNDHVAPSPPPWKPSENMHGKRSLHALPTSHSTRIEQHSAINQTRAKEGCRTGCHSKYWTSLRAHSTPLPFPAHYFNLLNR